jgi:hypothetical protein
MSFRRFVYYCSLFGGVGAYLGWALGRLPALDGSVALAATRGLFLGLALAVVLTVVDAVWHLSPRRAVQAGGRVLVSGLIGALAGFVGGGLGQLLYSRTQWALFLVVSWAFTGALIGAAPGTFDLLAALGRDSGAAGRHRARNGMLGGVVGGLLGGACYLGLQALWALALPEQAHELWGPSATGFVVLGMCVGLFVGLAQVILKEAWVTVEQGFRAGRELILTRTVTTVGRAEECDLGLFGDPQIEKAHARIVCRQGRYYLEDTGTPGGTFLNGERIVGSALLHDGDEVRLGRAVLRFGERRASGYMPPRSPPA